MKKTAMHTKYQLVSGESVPSVTTVLGILAKPALIHWAWELGTRGLDYRKERDQAADIGILAHYLILCDLQGEKAEIAQFSAEQINKAETALIKYWDWRKGNPIEPILVETSLISERHGFGGTIDCLAHLGDKMVLLDYKTGKAIYPEMLYQLAAYEALLKEAGKPVTEARILRIGRDENEAFEERVFIDLSTEWEIFLACLRIYKLRQSHNPAPGHPVGDRESR